jgi:aconitase A
MNTPLTSTRRELVADGLNYHYYSLPAIPGMDLHKLACLPYSIRILLEGALRHHAAEDVAYLADWRPQAVERKPVAFFPGRVVMQDLSGVPVMNDMAGLRAARAFLSTWSSITQSTPTSPGRQERWRPTKNWNSNAMLSATSSCNGARTRLQT